MDDAAADLFSQLTKLPPAEIEARLAQQAVPADFNWRGLAEVASSEALSREPTEPEARSAWARVARLAYDRLAADAQDEYERDRYTCDMMRLRAELINRLGAVPGDPLLDCDEIFQWFLSRRADEFEAAAGDTTRWRELPIERIRHLRYIKNEVAVLRMLGHCTPHGTPEVQRWLELWDHLP